MIEKDTLYKSETGKREIFAFCDRLLSRWGCPVESRYVETDFGRTHAYVSGDPSAPVLVALHGHAINAAMWYSIAGKLSQHYRLYCIDLVGQPGKSAANILDDDYDQYARWLAQALDGFGIDKATLMGVSFGGWLTLKFTVMYPERVNKFVALAPAGLTPVRWLTLFRALSPALWGNVDKATNNLAQGEPIEPHLATAMALVLKYTRSRALLIPKLTDAELRGLTTRGLFINGTNDVFFHGESSAKRMQIVPNTDVHVIEGASHLIPITQTDVILPLIYDFLGIRDTVVTETG